MKLFKYFHFISCVSVIFFTFFCPLSGETAPETSTPGDPFSQLKFLPSISFILDVSYRRGNLNQEEYGLLEIPGFSMHSSHEEHGHDHGVPTANGFSLNYGEMVLSASVDPYFDMFASFHLSSEGFAMEEAYVSTRSLPWGMQLKAGRFLSSFGRVNAQHAHLWEFSDIPLPQRVFFGDEGLADAGVQLNWTAPAPFYLSLGVELFQGSEGNTFASSPFHVIDSQTGGEYRSGETPAPNIAVFFGKSSVDIGPLTVLGGVSLALGKYQLSSLEESEELFAFSGDSRLFGLDLYARYSIDSYRYVSFQAEYISRITNGDWFEAEEHSHADSGAVFGEEHDHNLPEMKKSDWERSQAAFYIQGVFRFQRFWRLGGRFEAFHKNQVSQDGGMVRFPEDLKRWSFMLEFSPTEFSRIRLQYRRDCSSWLEGALKRRNELSINLNFAIGAHGAHSF